MMQKIVIALPLALLALPATTRATTTVTSTQSVRIGGEPTIPNGIVTLPQIVTHPNAAYTDEARRRGIQGAVVVQAHFDIDGNFKVLRIVKGLGYGLDESAVAALQNWRFTPATRNGERVSVVAEIEVPFRLLDADQLRKLRDTLEAFTQRLSELQRLHQQLQSAGHN
jgi:TonB family protein